MTDNPCNCSNCSNWDQFFPGCKTTFSETSIFGEKETIHPFMKEITKQVGCLSHPQARCLLMQDVVEELTRCYDSGEYDNYSLREIIALIRGGVKP